MLRCLLAPGVLLRQEASPLSRICFLPCPCQLSFQASPNRTCSVGIFHLEPLSLEGASPLEDPYLVGGFPPGGPQVHLRFPKDSLTATL